MKNNKCNTDNIYNNDTTNGNNNNYYRHIFIININVDNIYNYS